MFEHVEMAPADPILGLTEAFKKDPNDKKINLGVGIYKDEHGITPIMEAVKFAEEKLFQREETKGYLPIAGTDDYSIAVQQFLFGADSSIIFSQRAATIHAPGGTGALRMAGELLHKISPKSTLWVSDPTWANHKGIFSAAGLNIKTYPYYDEKTKGFDFEAMIAAIEKIPEGDIVLLHGCCHNPTGVDPTPEQWNAIAQAISDSKLLPLVDFAYQGLAVGIEEDAIGLREIAKLCDTVFVASSFSKNFGLYCERAGALTLVCETPEVTQKVLSQLKTTVRQCYSNPPAHGGLIIATIMNDEKLRTDWEAELAKMRERIQHLRELFVETLKDLGVQQDFSFIKDQKGMFSFSGLTDNQVQQLREKHSIYVVRSGRINVAGMTSSNMPRLCNAIKEVLE